jgi:hypothetical protein
MFGAAMVRSLNDPQAPGQKKTGGPVKDRP